MQDDNGYPWPLQPHHLFGANNYDLRYHTGRESLTDTQALARWQRAYSERIDHTSVQVTGRFDGATQGAVVHVQRLARLPITGCLDEATWGAVWTVQRPPRPEPPTAPTDPRPPRVKRSVRPQRSSTYWRRYSKAGLDYGRDPDAPYWFPGKPFARNEVGWHVRMVQEILGLNPTGRFTAETETRVRGIQRANKLPVSGVVDAATAAALDPGPYLDDDDELE